jgi:hypothetical protein
MRLSQRRVFNGLYDLACCKNAAPKINIATSLDEIDCPKCKEISKNRYWFYHSNCGCWQQVFYDHENIQCEQCYYANLNASNEVKKQLSDLYHFCIFCGKEGTQRSLRAYLTCETCDAVLTDWLLEHTDKITQIEELQKQRAALQHTIRLHKSK